MIDWTPALARHYGGTVDAIARLDARISVSPVLSAWQTRAAWRGYASALSAQRVEIDEIDVFSLACGIALPGRPPIVTTADPLANFTSWVANLDEPSKDHWRDALPFTFDPPEGWHAAPPLLRALTLLDIWARRDSSIAVWLALPTLLQGLGVTQTKAASLVVNEPALRSLFGPREAHLLRLMKLLRNAARDGLTRLERLEDWRVKYGAVLAARRRPGLLAPLGALALRRPLLSGSYVAEKLGVSVSGAGKVLERATRENLLVEISGRRSWRRYVASDIAVALGLVAPLRGRPPSPSQHAKALDEVLSEFDREMQAIDRLLAGHSSVGRT